VSRSEADANNIDLSQRRADAVKAAVFAALAEPGKGPIPATKDIRAAGKGSRPFNPLFSQQPDPSGQTHLDPFSAQAASNRDKIATDAQNFYPTLRRVDIVMNGIFALRIFGD
jgi:outer membrane protein OmpA-like peptidoglycan-associated protein